MGNGKEIFRIEIKTDEQIWRNMNIYAMLSAGNSKDGEPIRAEHDSGLPQTSMTITLPEPSQSATLCLYVVPRQLPSSDLVVDSPCLDFSFDVYRGDALLEHREIPINQWGGIQLIRTL